MRVYATRDTKTAACRACGGHCDRLLDKAVYEGSRAGGLEDAREVRARLTRDWYIPIGLLATVALLHLIFTTATLGPRGVLSTPVWIFAGTAIVTSLWWIVHRFISLEFEPPAATVLKLAAIYMTVHLVRAFLFDAADLRPPEQGPLAGLQALGSLGPLAFILVIIPAIIVGVGAKFFFELDLVELAVAVATLFISVTGTFVLLKLLGVPG